MKCPKCGVVLVKALPNQKIISMDNNIYYTIPIAYFEYSMTKGKVLRKAFMCPNCGAILVDKRFEEE